MGCLTLAGNGECPKDSNELTGSDDLKEVELSESD